MREQLIVTNRLATIGEIASGIAHDLNNPLTNIIGLSELLLDKAVPSNVTEDLKTIRSEAQRAAGIVKTLLSFTGKYRSEKQPVNINDSLDRLLRLRAGGQKLSNIEVITRFAPDLPQVLAIPSQLEQVFFNIIINAEYFMVEARRSGVLTIVTEKVGNTVRAIFADDGPGIPAKNVERVFDLFFTTKETGRGTGLGLSVCRGIITAHGGRIYAESEPGQGARFIVELPIAC